MFEVWIVNSVAMLSKTGSKFGAQRVQCPFAETRRVRSVP
jgi:hypothetical protein